MTSSNPNPNKSPQSETIYFFDQPDPNKSTKKRQKKFVDDQFLNKMNKKASNPFSNVTIGDPSGQPMSLASRVAELAAATAAKTAMDATPEMGSDNPSVMSTAASVSSYTDTRLQAVKYLTEDFLKELEDILLMYAESDAVPNLPGPVIFDLHSDWTDLTDKCDKYKKFPEWQTRKGKEALRKPEKADKKNAPGSALDEHGGEKKEAQPGKNTSRRSSTSTKSKKDASGGGNPKLVRRSSKLGSINEDNFKSPSQLGAHKISPATGMASLPHGAPHTAVQPPTLLLKSKPESVSSRVMNQANQAAAVAGCLLSYQLSSRLYRDKGWTVVHVDGEAELVDNGKRILAYLKNSIMSM
jgi:hypothetical protein